MASLFSHGLVAVTLQHTYPKNISTRRLWMILVICSILPDADVVGFFWGIPYQDMWGHRGITHSLFFAFLLALIVTFTLFRDVKFISLSNLLRISLIFLATASHGLLDAMTNGGYGIAFFAPFDNSRYFLPWTPIVVSPIGVKSFFSEWGVRVILSELLLIGVPCSVLLLFAQIRRKLTFSG